MPTITLASILNRTKAYLQNSSYMSDEDIITEIQLFMDVELPLQNTLKIFSGVWRFQTKPHEYVYQMPLDRYTSIDQFMLINGVREEIFFNEREFYYDSVYDNYQENNQASTGDGTSQYTFTLAEVPVLRGFKTLDNHRVPRVFFSAEDVTGAYAQCDDDGTGTLTGELVNGGINYITGDVTLNFTNNIAQGTPIYGRTIRYTPGYPYRALFRGDGGILELRSVPDKEYIIEIEARVKPSVLVQEMDRLQYNWLFDYIALGAARRIFTMLINDDMLRRTEERYNYYRYLINNRSAQQQAAREVRTVYTSSIYNPE